MKKMSPGVPAVARENKVTSLARSGETSLPPQATGEGFLKAAIDSLEDELLVIDRDYRIIQANEAVLSRYGRHRTGVIGKFCYEITHHRSELCHPPRDECPVRAVWQTGKAARLTHCHTYHIGIQKRERYLDIIASPIKDSQGNVTAVVELMRDVTEAKETELRNVEAYQNLVALNAIATAVSQSLNLDTVLQSALEKTLEVMNRHTGGILLWNEEKQMLCYRVHHSLSPNFVQTVCLPPGEGIVGRVFQSGRPILADDISTDSRIAYPGLIATEGLRAFAAVPLRVKDKVLGVITIASHEVRKFSTEDIQLLESIASQIAIAVENARLHEEVQHKDESRGELLGEIFSIQEEERRRIARELHDETSQSLASLAVSLEAIAGRLPAGAADARDRIKKMGQVVISILDEVHKLIYELRPTLLDDLGLVAAARWLAENNLGTAGVTVNFKTVGRVKRLPHQVETTLFRVIQEAVSNVARHAHASNADLSLHFKKSSIGVHVRDDGDGFNVEAAITSRDRPRGLGLLGMKERVELMNGTLDIRSHTGGGTKIDIEIPINYEVSRGQDKDTHGR
jgi:PAS domain S-box-containing protein